MLLNIVIKYLFFYDFYLIVDCCEIFGEPGFTLLCGNSEVMKLSGIFLRQNKIESIFHDEIGRIGLQHAYSRRDGLISGVEFDVLTLFSNCYFICMDVVVGLHLLVLLLIYYVVLDLLCCMLMLFFI